MPRSTSSGLRRVSVEQRLDALKEGFEQALLIEPGQRGVRHCLDVAQPAGQNSPGLRPVRGGKRHAGSVPQQPPRSQAGDSGVPQAPPVSCPATTPQGGEAGGLAACKMGLPPVP
jgi:hypothetical protein